MGKSNCFEIKNKFTAVCLTRALIKKLKNNSYFLLNFTQNHILNDLGDSVEIKFAQDIQHLCNSIGEMPIPPY